MNFKWFMQECADFFSLCGERCAWEGAPGTRIVDRAQYGLGMALAKAKLIGKEIDQARAAYEAVLTNYQWRNREGSSMGWISSQYPKQAPHGWNLFEVLGDSAQQAMNAEFLAASRTALPRAIAALRAARTAAAEASKQRDEANKYMRHFEDCPRGKPVKFGEIKRKCTCGLDAFLATLDAKGGADA